MELRQELKVLETLERDAIKSMSDEQIRKRIIELMKLDNNITDLELNKAIDEFKLNDK